MSTDEGVRCYIYSLRNDRGLALCSLDAGQNRRNNRLEVAYDHERDAEGVECAA